MASVKKYINFEHISAILIRTSDQRCYAQAVDENVVLFVRVGEKLSNNIQVRADASSSIQQVLNLCKRGLEFEKGREELSFTSATGIGVEWQLSRRMPWKVLAVCSTYSRMCCHKNGQSSGFSPYLIKKPI
jgi:hypothetical protein